MGFTWLSVNSDTGESLSQVNPFLKMAVGKDFVSILSFFDSPPPGLPDSQFLTGTGSPCEAPLGNNVKCLYPPSTVFDLQSLTEPQLKRVSRYVLQSVARSIIPEFAISKCLRVRQKDVEAVEVRKGKDRPYYGGLQHCHSVWSCPVCSAKIAEERREDLKTVVETWQAQGGTVLLVSYTVRHNIKQKLIEVLKKALHSRSLMMNRKSYRRLRARIGLAGSVRSLEVTYGENGWHVHFHEILFLNKLETFLEWCLTRSNNLEQIILPMWQDACRSAGLSSPDHHGVKVQNGDKAGGYVAKWGMDSELTKGHIKQGREGHYTPWDFLRMCDQGGRWGDLFREYSRAFKGKRQLFWSHGFRKLLNLGKEKTDEEIAGQIDELDPILGRPSWEEWRLILWKEVRGEFAEIAYISSWQAAISFLYGLVGRGIMQ